MKATALIQRRVEIEESAFVEMAVWRLPTPLPPSVHDLRYRLAYVVLGQCVVLYDNERGKGDHRHYGKSEHRYEFVSLARLVADFEKDVDRWNLENRDP